MKKIETYAYLKKNNKVHLLEFSLANGKYDLIGQYDRFYEGKNLIALESNDTPSFTAVFVDLQKVYRGLEGKFVGFGKGLIFFEDAQNNLLSLDVNRTIAHVAFPSEKFVGKWQKENLLFYVEKHNLKAKEI